MHNKEARRLAPDLSLFLQKLYMRLKQVVCSFVSVYFHSPQLGIILKQMYKTLDYCSREMLNFDFLEKGLSNTICGYFSRKMLDSIN